MNPFVEEAMRLVDAYIESHTCEGCGGKWPVMHLPKLRAALEAHLSQTGEPVAKVVEQEFEYPWRTRIEPFGLSVAQCQERLPVGTKLYAAPQAVHPAKRPSQQPEAAAEGTDQRALVEDAARYRWLRQAIGPSAVIRVVMHVCPAASIGATPEACIDAAIADQKRSGLAKT